jgi:hypothetical protein
MKIIDCQHIEHRNRSSLHIIQIHYQIKTSEIKSFPRKMATKDEREENTVEF